MVQTIEGRKEWDAAGKDETSRSDGSSEHEEHSYLEALETATRQLVIEDFNLA
jgi:hypothetical protein